MTMTYKEALAIVSRQAPCPHGTFQTLGTGQWLKCDDCGRTISAESADLAHDTSERFEAAMDVLIKNQPVA